ncbi:Por secretion system C-terminal sorting domain-containing protein [Chitinophaga sp. YR573]|uniref:discoidin domain-containing protein n=1 Tax=Chitinophaga sp. YR573 TaxID=1881040 RepID=UPI0008D5331D|nr:discoidin domain-containing protein [Chitinophaga sp. YR573]SEW46093.1 Por secretion system C-terminal sorting domain-containing protein [Chitinophaga sp. YR573]
MKTQHRLYAFLFVLLCSHPLFAQDVYINLNQPHQGIDGAGFCHEGDRQNGNTYVISTAIQQMLDNHMTLFRDMFPNKVWEPSKGTFNGTDSRVVSSFQRLKTMQDKGIKTILGIWDVPDWMVSNPSAGSNRKINNFDDFAYFITSYLVYGKNNYGLTVDYVDVNETKTSGVNISLTAQEYITLIQKCQTLFTANGIKTKMSIGSVLLWDIQYNKDIYNAVKSLSVAGNPTWHTYRGGSTTGREPISYWEAWGAWQQTLDRNLWGTETDYDAYYWENPDRLTWQGVEEMAVMYYRNYYIARMSTSSGWFWHPEWPSNNVHTAYMNNFEPGGQVVETSQPDGDVMTVAYKHTTNKKFVIQVLNQASSTHTVTFHGVPANKPLTLIRTSEAGDRSKTVGTYTPSGTDFTITLQANSFNTFTGALDGVVDVVAPSTPANLRSTGKTSTSISLAWDASSDNIGVAGYQVFNAANTLLGTASTTSTTLQGLTANTSYTLVVKAYDAAGNFSAGSSAITVETDTATTQSGAATVYADCNFTGSGVSLTPGTYTLSQLQALGVLNDDISSVRVKSGYKITLYTDGGFSGTAVTLTADDNCLVDNSFNDLTSSVKVETYSPNIAYSRPVFTTSNEDATVTGDKAVDANGNTRWSSSYANNQSIVVDLGANYNVNRVRLAWEAAYATDYQIQFSTDNTTWTTVREFWGKTSAVADDQTGLSGTARYVKVYCINRATAYGFSLYEFEIYGTLAGAAMVAAKSQEHSNVSEGISIFPNPAHDQVTVKLGTAWLQNSRLVLLGTDGKYIISRPVTSTMEILQLSSLPAGLYILKVSNAKGQITRKIIKE